MARGILYVETQPSAPERTAEYHAWYDETHLREVVAMDGFVSARRLAPPADDGPFVALYEIEADDLQAVVDRLLEAVLGGEFHMSDALRTDPMPLFRLLETITVYEAEPVSGRHASVGRDGVAG
ncbi:hypothetical protein OG874_11100 [Nocardia sp. NBC_00565]|uniref:hypothetical protein n=1 Tax=Nocardia sp. NBC_00565 TaxID=2975993 RepID=UPI002E804CBF|nr:hypothetical protein [Nocardia sp. NBC_00565]WUC05648.1 hypothetical protein OG874_11100 [Nocardia sp. NBC_00565]